MSNMDCISKSARWELDQQERLKRRVKSPIEYVSDYEFRGHKLGEIVKASIESGSSDKIVDKVEVKIIGFQLDAKVSSRFIAVTIEGELPKYMKGLFYEEAGKNRLVDVVLKGHEKSPLMWVKEDSII